MEISTCRERGRVIESQGGLEGRKTERGRWGKGRGMEVLEERENSKG